ncbi:MAG: hypothetical protein LPJ91_10180 [Pseudazoarcus pumilus]|nr:hypothetical protein [Pseudazoarcus pumilus]
MKIQQKQIDPRIRRLRIANHFFLLTATLFVIHQNVFRPAPPVVEVPVLAQAIQYQPQTPPPGFDPEQTGNEELDLSVRPEERPYSTYREPELSSGN